MTQEFRLTPPTESVARRIKELRLRRGWSAEALAQRCRDLGMPELNRSVIANIESGRRKYVTVDEAFAVAYALEVALVHLLVPTDLDASEVDRYLLVPDRPVTMPAAREWIRGTHPADADPRVYFSEVPRGEFRPVIATADTAYNIDSTKGGAPDGEH